MDQPKSLEALIKLLKKTGVMHYSTIDGGVELDFTCAACDSHKEKEAEEPAPVLALAKQEPEPVDPDTGLTKAESDELFRSTER
jgi:hypothetical protein